MKQIFISLFFALATLTSFAQNYPTLEIGQKCPSADLKLWSVDKEFYQLKDNFNGDGLLVIFTCNTCPFVVKWEDRYKMLEKLCRDNNVKMVYVNSNAKKRGDDDSFQAMQDHAKKLDYQFPYVLDKNSSLANAFGAKTTPHIFLFNKEKVLVYKGAIDDNYESAKDVRNFYLKDAIEQMVGGVKIKTAKTKAVGCSIKRYKN